MFSIGDWRYTKNFESSLFDDNQNLVGTGTLYLEDVKVGDAAQTTASLGVDYDLSNSISLDANYRFVDGLYADYSIEDFDTVDNDGALKLPSYGLVDFGATARFTLLGMDSSFRVNII